MITVQEIGGIFNRNVLKLVGKSINVKPTDTLEGQQITNGSTLYEMDTKKIFMFDFDTKTWIEQ